MAKLSILDSEIETTDFQTIQNFLLNEGIEFGKFNLTGLADELAKKQTLDEEERIRLIEDYPGLRGQHSRFPGYRADVICLYPEFAHLEAVLSKFKDIHFHFENEHWYFIDGGCGFAFLGSNGLKYLVEVQKGEHITVPEGKWQWLVPPKSNQMKTIRYFNKTGLIPEQQPIGF